jgi:hypothetical protein
MYRRQATQLQFENFYLPFGGRLRSDNRWVVLAKLIPWTEFDPLYADTLADSGMGCPAKNVRIALGSLIIKERLGTSDEETVAQIQENPYLQYFLGFHAYRDAAPFDPSMFVHFRKRLGADIVMSVNDRVAQPALCQPSSPGGHSSQTERPSCADGDRPRDAGATTDMTAEGAGSETPSDTPEPPSCADGKRSRDAGAPADMTADGAESAPPSEQAPVTEQSAPSASPASNRGKLIVDATCAPADIAYPTDLNLLNEAREMAEQIIDVLHGPLQGAVGKPRTYRQKARKEYLSAAKARRLSSGKRRMAIGKQLRYVHRDLVHIERLLTDDRVTLLLLSPRQYRKLLVIHELYRQQKQMFDQRCHRIDGRIVSLSQPHIRPIVRGKANAPTEFGAKLSAALIGGYAFLDQIGWDNFNESTRLTEQIEDYRNRFGCYPASVHADKIYRTRDNRTYCRERGIRLSGPPLGRPPKVTDENRQALDAQKQLARQDERDRIAIEGTFGQGKRRFGLGRVMAKLAVTSECAIAVTFLVMNLEKRLRSLFSCLFLVAILKTIPSIYAVFTTISKSNVGFGSDMSTSFHQRSWYTYAPNF